MKTKTLSGKSVFFCEPYQCWLEKQSCSERQKRAVKIARSKHVAFNSIKTADWIEKCVYCEQGVEK